MKGSGHLQIGVWQVFLFCFWLGILAGTAVGNWETAGRAGTEETYDVFEGKGGGGKLYPGITPWRRQAGDREKFGFLCWERLKEGGLGWLLGMTVYAPFGFCLMAVYMGFVFGWTITWYTIELGIMGLPRFFLSCFPQVLMYLPAWGILVWQGLEGKAKLRLIPSLLAASLLSIGAGLEAFINPLFL